MHSNIDLIKGLIVRIDQHVYSVKGDRKTAVKMLKNLKNNFNDIYRLSDDKFKENFQAMISSNIINPYITSNFFPENIEEYGKYKALFTFTNDLKLELRWLIFCLKFYSNELSIFLLKREQYDNCVLLNKYEDALKIVNDIEEKFGVSLWSIECQFYLYVKMGKDINELLKNIPQSVIGAIINFFELRNRENVTSDEYFYIVEREIRGLKKLEGKIDKANIELYKYYIQTIMYQTTPEDVLTLLEASRSLSLIDKYLLFGDICEFALWYDKNSEIYSVIQKYITELSKIEDDHLDSLRFVFDEKKNRETNYTMKTRLDKAKTKFIKGNLREARQDAIDLLRLFPNNVEAINLCVDINILLEEKVNEFEETNLGILLGKLKSIYTLDNNRDDSIDIINKFINICFQSTWAKNIQYSIMYRCQAYGKGNYEKAKLLTCLQHLDVETMLASLSRKEAIEYITENFDMLDDYMIFRKAILEENYKLAKKVCAIDQIKDLLEVCNEKSSVKDRIAHLRKIKGKDASIAIMGMKKFLATIDLQAYLELVMQISTELIVDNIHASLFIPLKEIIDFIDDAEEEIRSNICSPILYYVYATYFQRDRMDDLGIICEDFFRFEEIERPTKMDIYKYKKELLIYFLRYVCIPKIMDISIPFNGTQERDQERVEICNILCEIDVANVKEYEEEIRAITQKLMINKELKTIEENRIHVNIDGIKDRLNKSYKNDFMRYKFYQDERIMQFTLLKEGENAEKFKFIQNAPERIFREMVLRIRDAFVSSDEYGLNGYLSLNFRHGTLEDELRSPLSKALLTAKKNITTNEYTINEHWIRDCNLPDIKIINKAISQFHVETEAIISKLKNKYIQIQTEEKNIEGVFDYRLYDKDFLYLVFATNACTTFDEFLDKIITYLWEKTEENLSKMKTILKTEILDDYGKSFSN